MKCNNCYFASWERTKNGRLHPNKQGRCKYLKLHPLNLTLPDAFYFIGSLNVCGGHIERDRELIKNGKPSECPFFCEIHYKTIL